MYTRLISKLFTDVLKQNNEMSVVKIYDLKRSSNVTDYILHNKKELGRHWGYFSTNSIGRSISAYATSEMWHLGTAKSRKQSQKQEDKSHDKEKNSSSFHVRKSSAIWRILENGIRVSFSVAANLEIATPHHHIATTFKCSHSDIFISTTIVASSTVDQIRKDSAMLTVKRARFTII